MDDLFRSRCELTIHANVDTVITYLKWEVLMQTVEVKIARIGNSRGVRIPADVLRRYAFTDTAIMVESVDGVKSVDINLVFEPEWHRDMMSEEAKLELGFL